MFLSTSIFTYVDKRTGVTQDGETYAVLDLINKKDKKKYSLLTKKPEVIDKITGSKFIDYQDIKVELNFSREFNPHTRYSNWSCEINDIDGVNVLGKSN